MTQRFFFDLTDGLTTIRDDVGVVVDSLNEAVKQAEEVLQEMRFGNELSSRDERWTLSIRDAVGETLMLLSVAPPDPPAEMAS
ncbi:DUF6894 family protein [Methylobacterium sp. J-090]|uniref:DUF6894 family protein n=1 Tax=Methylobacterium sp. J-090 TaxID=2836666 RepID=UPI00391C5B50